MTGNDDLFAAIADHDPDRIAALLAQGADPDGLQSDPPHWYPLHASVDELEYGGPIEALILLIRAGATVDAWDAANDATPLLVSVFRRRWDAMQLLLAAGAEPAVNGAEGDSPLRWCVEHGELEAAATLLRCDARKTIDEAGGPTGMTALGHAASRCDVAMVELLLAHGADPSALDADHRTARARMPSRNAGNAGNCDAVVRLLEAT